MLIVYSFSQFINTIWEWTNEERKKGESIVLYTQAACLLSIYVFLMMFCYKLHSIYGERWFDFSFAYVGINENDLSTIYMLSPCVCIDLQQRCHTNQPQMIEKLIDMKWWIKRMSKRMKIKQDKVRKKWWMNEWKRFSSNSLHLMCGFLFFFFFFT